MYFGYNHHSHSHPHSMSLPSQSMTQGINSSIMRSALLEPQVITLQRESENYIRRVEHEKKHYYSVEETWALVEKEWKEKKDRLVQVQKRKQSPKQIQLHAKVKNLENDLQQAISKLNETQSGNHGLQRQIDSLRKERVQYLNIYDSLQKQISNTEQVQDTLEKHKQQMLNQSNKSKEQIALLKRKNDSEKDVYVEQFDRLQKEVLDEKRQREQTKLAARKEKIEGIDTGTLMKQRLKRVIANNKEKVKIIDQYLRNMRVIDEAFTQIKDASGITDIEEIMNTFIKSEEQNYSLYNYVDILSQEIDSLTEQNDDLHRKISQQEEDNDVKIRQMKATPIAVKSRRRNDNIIKEKQDQIDDLRKRMDSICPGLQQILIELGATKLAPDSNKQFDYQLAFNLNESSLEHYLQDLEYYINLLVAKQQISLNESVVHSTLLLDQIPLKEFATTKSQQPNFTLEELALTDNTKLLDTQRLRQQAVEMLKKKKQQ